jgi:hypothetical protein
MSHSCIDAVGPLLVKALAGAGSSSGADSSSSSSAAIAAAAAANQLQSSCYQLLNSLMEGSSGENSSGQELQLLVLPSAVREAIQELLPAAAITGVSAILCG